MTNPQKAKGTSWESLIVSALRAFSSKLKPYRPAQAGYKDTGDVHGVSPFIIQAKNYRDVATALREGLKGATVQAVNAGEDYGVVFLKRARMHVGDGAAVLRISDFTRVLLRLRRAELFLEANAPEAYARHLEETAEDKARTFPLK